MLVYKNLNVENLIIALLFIPLLILFPNNLKAKAAEYNIDYQEITTPNFKLAVWYPSVSKESAIRYVYYSSKAARNGTIADGKFPVIILAHGMGGSLYNQYYIAEYLTKRGYIVFAPQYRDEIGGYYVFINRPQITTLALNYMLQNWKYNNHVQTNKIGIVGHSAGGYTALTLAGARPDFLNICSPFLRKRGWCNFFIFKWYRKYITRYQTLPNDFYDPRIKAVVLMAPAGELFNKDSFKNVKIPVFMLLPEHDEVLNSKNNADLIANNLSKFPEIYKLKGAAHYSFLPTCDKFLQKTIPQICIDYGTPRKNLHTLINQKVYGFFKENL